MVGAFVLSAEVELDDSAILVFDFNNILVLGVNAVEMPVVSTLSSVRGSAVEMSETSDSVAAF